MSQKLESSRK